MSLVINTNIPAVQAARNVGDHFSQLGKSIARLSSGQKINSSADNPAGTAVRDMMRAEIAALRQGSGNIGGAAGAIVRFTV